MVLEGRVSSRWLDWRVGEGNGALEGSEGPRWGRTGGGKGGEPGRTRLDEFSQLGGGVRCSMGGRWSEKTGLPLFSRPFLSVFPYGGKKPYVTFDSRVFCLLAFYDQITSDSTELLRF